MLQWIADGCPAGVMSDDSYKVSAAALKSRRLVTITKKRGSWTARVTEAGAYFLEHHRYPDGHWPRTHADDDGYRRPRQVLVSGLPPTDQLVADVQAAGGRLPIPSRDFRAVDQLVQSAVRYWKVPPGYTLTWEHGADWSDRAVALVPLPEWIPKNASVVTVPATVRRMHPVVAAIRDNPHALPWERSTRSRALRLLHALCQEAERRGYRAEDVDRSGYRTTGLLQISIHGHPIVINVRELQDRTPHVATAKELRDKELYSWTRIPPYDHHPSGRLTLEILSGSPVHQRAFADTTRARLDDRLGAVLFEMEMRAAQFEQDRLERERREAEHARQWQTAYDRAVSAAREDYRLEILQLQQRDWAWHADMTRYLTALTEHLAHLPEPARSDAHAWLEWARDAVAARHPFANDLAIPTDPTFTPDRLAPHMSGFPPHPPRPQG